MTHFRTDIPDLLELACKLNGGPPEEEMGPLDFHVVARDQHHVAGQDSGWLTQTI